MAVNLQKPRTLYTAKLKHTCYDMYHIWYISQPATAIIVDNYILGKQRIFEFAVSVKSIHAIFYG